MGSPGAHRQSDVHGARPASPESHELSFAAVVTSAAPQNGAGGSGGHAWASRAERIEWTSVEFDMQAVEMKARRAALAMCALPQLLFTARARHVVQIPTQALLRFNAVDVTFETSDVARLEAAVTKLQVCARNGTRCGSCHAKCVCASVCVCGGGGLCIIQLKWRRYRKGTWRRSMGKVDRDIKVVELVSARIHGSSSSSSTLGYNTREQNVVRRQSVPPRPALQWMATQRARCVHRCVCPSLPSLPPPPPPTPFSDQKGPFKHACGRAAVQAACSATRARRPGSLADSADDDSAEAAADDLLQANDMLRSRTNRAADPSDGPRTLVQDHSSGEDAAAAPGPLLSVRSGASGASGRSRVLTDALDEYTHAEGRALLFAHKPAMFARVAPRGSMLAAVSAARRAPLCHRAASRSNYMCVCVCVCVCVWWWWCVCVRVCVCAGGGGRWRRRTTRKAGATASVGWRR